MALDNIYWNPSEYDYEEPISTTLSKSYVDPWDLENYAYIQKYLGSSDVSSEKSSFEDTIVGKAPPLPAPVRSRVRKTMSQPIFSEKRDEFKYETNNRFSKRIPNRNNRETEDIYGVVDFESETEAEESSFEEPEVNTIDPQYLLMRNRRTSVIQSKPQSYSMRGRSSSYSFEEHEFEQHIPGSDIYHRLYNTADSDKTIPLYNDKPHFRLGKCGHLQIDYSWSWNNLDKYIYQ